MADALGTGNPWAVFSNLTLGDTQGPDLFRPPSGYDRYVLLRNVPRLRGMSDGEALDYAAALGFTPAMFGEPTDG